MIAVDALVRRKHVGWFQLSWRSVDLSVISHAINIKNSPLNASKSYLEDPQDISVELRMFRNVVEMIQDSGALDLRHVVNDSFDGSHWRVRRTLSPPLCRQCQHEVMNLHQKRFVVEFIDTFWHQFDISPNAFH